MNKNNETLCYFKALLSHKYLMAYTLCYFWGYNIKTVFIIHFQLLSYEFFRVETSAQATILINPKSGNEIAKYFKIQKNSNIIYRQ